MSGRKGLFFALGAMVAVFAMLVGVFIGRSASRGNETLSEKQPVSPYPMPIVNQVVEEPIAFLQRWALTRAAVGTRVRPGSHIKFGVETSRDVPRGLPATRADTR